MERERLVDALAGRGDAAELCREALLADAELTLSPTSVDTTELTVVYRRRAQHLRGRGIEAVGADEAADLLGRTRFTEVVVGRVSGGPGRHVFQLFLDPGGDELVACLAVADTASGS